MFKSTSGWRHEVRNLPVVSQKTRTWTMLLLVELFPVSTLSPIAVNVYPTSLPLVPMIRDENKNKSAEDWQKCVERWNWIYQHETQVRSSRVRSFLIHFKNRSDSRSRTWIWTIFKVNEKRTNTWRTNLRLVLINSISSFYTFLSIFRWFILVFITNHRH